MQRPTWMEYVEDYSQCILTYESDRLIALEGLANKLGKWQSGRYHLEYGWEK
jgi:hypothetical protein